MPRVSEFPHEEVLQALQHIETIVQRIHFLHGVVREHFGFIHRIGVAVVDPKVGCLKTFAQMMDSDSAQPQCQYSLSEASAIHCIVPNGRPCVINDPASPDIKDEHHRHLQAGGFRSSYTVPNYYKEQLAGFAFFDSREPDVFQSERMPHLDMIADQLSQLARMELKIS